MATDLEKAMGLVMETVKVKAMATDSVKETDLAMEKVKATATDLVSALDQLVLPVSRLDHLIPS